MTTEFDLIQQLQRRCPVGAPVEVGIGDDAAILKLPAESYQVVTTDMLMEGVDFLLESASPELVGRKSLAVNLSDIAAMGATPVAAFVAVSLPIHRGVNFAKRFYDGLLHLAEEFDVTIAGGDTNSWNGPFVCSLTVLGQTLECRPVQRSGARPGDLLFVTGQLGGSLAGRHLTFEPRIRESQRLRQLSDVHAMVDVSDGLAADLHHLLHSSGVGAELESSRIPIHEDVYQLSSDKTPFERALSDGEDFELLFTISSEDGNRLLDSWDMPTPLTPIGRIVAQPGCWMTTESGERYEVPPLGFKHPLERLSDDG